MDSQNNNSKNEYFSFDNESENCNTDNNNNSNKFYSPLNDKTPQLNQYISNTPDCFTLFSHEKNNFLLSLCVIKSDIPCLKSFFDKTSPSSLFLSLKTKILSPFQNKPLPSNESFKYKEYSRILNYEFKDNNIDHQICSKLLRTFIYFSTRYNINSIFNEDNIQTHSSDKNWGSIIRSFQMMYSKFFTDIQIIKYVKETLMLDLKTKNENSKLFLYIDNDSLLKIHYDLILLFFDNIIHLKNILSIDYFKVFIKSLPYLFEENQLIKLDSFIIKNIISPLSIGSILNSYHFITNQKVNVDQLSNGDNPQTKLIEAFNEIIYQFSFINEKERIISIIFNSVIFEDEIIAQCFQEKFPNDSNSQEENIDYNSKQYTIKEGINPIIFVHIRISDTNHSAISDIFKIRHNLGFIAYNKKYASYLYYIGEIEENLIALDPNHCQKGVQTQEDLLEQDVFDSFKTNRVNTILTKAENIGSYMILSLTFKSTSEYIELINDIKKFIGLNHNMMILQKDNNLLFNPEPLLIYNPMQEFNLLS